MLAHETPQLAIIAEGQRGIAILINVIAIMEDEVRRLLSHMPIGGIEASLIILASDNGEAQPVQRRPRRRQGTRHAPG